MYINFDIKAIGEMAQMLLHKNEDPSVDAQHPHKDAFGCGCSTYNSSTAGGRRQEISDPNILLVQWDTCLKTEVGKQLRKTHNINFGPIHSLM